MEARDGSGYGLTRAIHVQPDGRGHHAHAYQAPGLEPVGHLLDPDLGLFAPRRSVDPPDAAHPARKRRPRSQARVL